ncbi:putative diguanylate cyclase [Magnetofaba australis IT-1]|uniref:Putative diguanylate cyclase n=1 Tax=Magnetofaba australis IT-1 TaxID=1434232 RepID=A0A1Y2K6S5_9PROT|nr:putative diguanylate cyclase [Magnetofaba australis IT-1]
MAPPLLGLGAAWAIWVNRLPHETLTFVGRSGAARFVREGHRAHTIFHSLDFHHAATLIKRHNTHTQANHYLYQPVDDETYDFVWLDAAGDELLRVHGHDTHLNHFSEPQQSYYFGLAAELAWTRHLLRENSARLIKGEAIRFRLNDIDEHWISISPEGVRVFCEGCEQVYELDLSKPLWRGESGFRIAVKPDREGEQTRWIDFPDQLMPNELLFLKIWELYTGAKAEQHHLVSETQSEPHCPLTGLLATQMFHRELEKAVAQHNRRKRHLAVMAIEVANLAHIKHAFGRENGELALKTLAQRLRQKVRDSDLLGRLWHDELGVALVDFSGAEQIMPMVEALYDALNAPIQSPMGWIHTELHIGCGMLTSQQERWEALLCLARRRAYRQRLEAVVGHTIYGESGCGEHLAPAAQHAPQPVQSA